MWGARRLIYRWVEAHDTVMKFLLGLVLGLLIVPAAVWGYFRFGHPPVAVADRPFPFEKEIVKIPLHARIDRDMPRKAPIAATYANVTAGAKIYREQCASCHGLPGRNSDFAAHMYPRAPQLFVWHRVGVIGVSDDPAGETYWKVANGIRLTGMPSFDKVLSETQMWQVTLLLKNANETLPNEAVQLLDQPLEFEPPPPVKKATGKRQ
jgi:mono/diheme cytochrome c family protein